MKRYAVFAVTLMMVAGASTASSQEKAGEERGVFASRSSHQRADLAKVERRYLACLQSLNDGVVESAIAQVAHLKLYCPGKCFAGLQGALSRLAVTGRTPAIRYKAYLAMLVFDHPAMFVNEQEAEYSTEGQLFTAIGKRLQQSLIGYSDRKYVRPE
jgi:hypothetical protein